MLKVTPPNSYLINAFYHWLSDNNLTPYMVVATNEPGVSVPQNYVNNDEIILNISAQAINQLRIGVDALEFDAQFDKKTHHLYIPIGSITAIYAPENNLGMNFSIEEYKKYKPEAPTTLKKSHSKLSIVTDNKNLSSENKISKRKPRPVPKSKPKLNLVKTNKTD